MVINATNIKKLPKKISKRDNAQAAFEPGKIERAVFKASLSSLHAEKKAADIAEKTTAKVLKKVASKYKNRVPTIEDIQDIVEQSLIDGGFIAIAKNYILYRKEHQDIRQAKSVFGIKDDLKIPINSLLVLKQRYLLKDDKNNIIETPGELFQRTAKAVSEAELGFSSPQERRRTEEAFLKMMTGLEFLPNSPTLMNAGTSIGQLSACFVLPVADDLENIFESVKNMAMIHRTGGGTGFDFSRLRPRGEMVSTTKGKASGPVSFMSIFNQTTEVIIQGSRRRGANMGILRCDHPDIFEFIEAKLKEGAFSNFNLSAMVRKKSLNWQKLQETVHLSIRFLDDVIETTKYPLPQIKDMTLANRKIGLGVMGFADMLLKMEISYNDSKAEDLARKVMAFIRRHSLQASKGLAEKRGPFPNIDKSVYFKKNMQMRNATVNAIAPTGTISIIAGCSSGIEPIFSLSYARNVLGGTKLIEIHPLFEGELQKRGIYSRELMSRIKKHGSIQKSKANQVLSIGSDSANGQQSDLTYQVTEEGCFSGQCNF